MCSPPQVSGRLRLFVKNWSLITSDPWILETIRFGYKIEFSHMPLQSHGHFPPTCFSQSEQASISAEVENMLAKGAIRQCSFHKSQFILTISLVPKKSGGMRPVINLKRLNTFVRYLHFKMENINSLIDLLRPNDFIATIDLKDAYFTVPIHVDHSKFLRFYWDGLLYEFIVLPFGLVSAPRVFTKLMKPIIAYLRGKSMRLIIFLDDIAVLGNSFADCSQNVLTVIQVLEEMGFIVNTEKSCLVPKQVATYIGYLLDKREMKNFLTRGKTS